MPIHFMIDREARRGSLLLCLLFCVALGILIVISLHYSYQQAQDYAERSLRHSSDLIAEWMIGAFAASDYVLRDIAGHIDPAELLYPHPDSQSQQRLTRLLLDKKKTVPYAFLVGAFNAECRVTHTNAYVGFDASDREYCQLLRDDPTRESVVTLGYTSNTGQFNVTQARRLRNERDAFVGLVAIGVDLAFFSRWLEKIDIVPHASIAIIDHQATILARKPLYEGAVGEQVVVTTVTAFLASGAEFELFKMPSPIDGVKRLFGARRVADLPFIVIVGLASDKYLKAWRLQVLISLSMLLLLWSLAIATLRAHWALIAQSGELAKIAHKDTLTQIPNRRYFVELAERERQKAQRHHTPLSLLLLDVDQFKKINDRYGHAAGDRALVAFKATCQQVLREVDIFGRWGGDEFVVLLPDGYDIAESVAERVRRAVQQTKVTDDKGRSFGLRTTIGFASTEGQEDTVPSLDELFSHADRALYTAKEAGRNRVNGCRYG